MQPNSNKYPNVYDEWWFRNYIYYEEEKKNEIEQISKKKIEHNILKYLYLTKHEKLMLSLFLAFAYRVLGWEFLTTSQWIILQ